MLAEVRSVAYPIALAFVATIVAVIFAVILFYVPQAFAVEKLEGRWSFVIHNEDTVCEALRIPVTIEGKSMTTNDRQNYLNLVGQVVTTGAKRTVHFVMSHKLNTIVAIGYLRNDGHGGGVWRNGLCTGAWTAQKRVDIWSILN